MTGRDSSSVSVFRRDSESGTLTFVQQIRNGNSTQLGLNEPTSIAVVPGDAADNAGSVMIGSAAGFGENAGGIAAFSSIPPDVEPPSGGFAVSFEAPAQTSIALLGIETGDHVDTISQLRPANSANTEFNTAGGGDFVTLFELAGTTTLNTADGSDEIELRSALPDTTLTVNAGNDADVIRVRRTGTGSTTTIDTGAGEDRIEVSGLALLSDITINEPAGDPPPPTGEDILAFDSQDKQIAPTIPVVPDGTIKIEDETSPAATYYTVHYFDILEVQTFAPPLADAGGPYVIDEGIEAQGGSITLDGTGSISNSPIVSYQWDINGDGSFGDKTTAEPTLTWDELRDFGLDDGLAEYQIALKVTNELGLDNEAFATVTINDTPPTVDVQIVDPAPTQPPLVGDLVRIEFTSTDFGIDSPVGWSIDWDGSGEFDEYSGNASTASHRYDDTGDYEIEVRVTDDDGATASGYTSVTVDAAPPVLGQSVTIAEGDNLELTATVIGTPTVNWDLDGDGEFDDAEGVTINVLWNTLQPVNAPCE